MFYAILKICTGTFKTHWKRVLFTLLNTNVKENTELTHNKDCFLKIIKFSLYMDVIYLPSYFWMLLRGKIRFAAEQVTLLSPFCPEMNVLMLFSRSR